MSSKQVNRFTCGLCGKEDAFSEQDWGWLEVKFPQRTEGHTEEGYERTSAVMCDECCASFDAWYKQRAHLDKHDSTQLE